MNQLQRTLRAVADEAKRKADLYAAQGKYDSAHVMRGVADAVTAAQPLDNDPTRAGKFAAMKIGCDPFAPQTLIYGIKLLDMNDEEIRIAAYWLTSQHKTGVTRA